MYIISIIGIFISTISVFYYLRIVKILYFNDIYSLKYNSFNLIPKENALILSCSFLTLFLFMLYPNIMLLFINKLIFFI